MASQIAPHDHQQPPPQEPCPTSGSCQPGGQPGGQPGSGCQPSSGCPPSGGCLPDCTLENAMKIIVDIYHQYAPREGKDDCLSLKDLTELLKCQAKTFLSACNRSNPNYIPHLFKQCDVDGNKKLTFEETIRVFAQLADDAHRISHCEDRCGPDKD